MNPLSVTAWAAELGMDYKTLRKRLIQSGVEIRQAHKFTIGQIFRAWTGDKEAAQAREANARAELLENKLRLEREQIFTGDQFDKMFNELVMPLRARLLAMPAECAVLCNPTDPQFARLALDSWVRDNLPRIRNAVKANSSNDKS
jgi:hypothetical protein